MQLDMQATKKKPLRAYFAKVLLSVLAMLLFPDRSQGQEVNLDSVYVLIQTSEDEKDFAALHELIYFDEGITDSIKEEFSILGIERSKKLGFDYHFAQFTMYSSTRATISGDNSKAIELANRSLEIFLRLEEYTEASQCYNSIGSMIATSGDTETGKKYLKKAIEYNKLEKDDFRHDRVQLDHLIVYGNILLKTDVLDSAFLITSQALDLTIQNDFLRQRIFCSVNLGRILKRQEKYVEARGYLSSALGLAKPTNMQLVKAVSYNHLADIAVALNQVDSAFHYFDQGLEVCKNHDTFLPIQLDMLEKKAKLYAENGLSNFAYQIQLEHIALKDSFFSLEKEKEIQSVQAEFKAREKDRDIELLSQQTTIQALQIKQRNQALIIGLIAFLLILSIVYFFYKSRSSKRKRLQAELLQQMRESELKALRSQMNPHFVFNALNSIQEYIMSNERKLAGKYLGKFADLMRVYLEHSKVTTVSVSEEIEALSLYLELEKLRFEDSLECSIAVEENVDTSLPIPSLLIQPYVENAIKHGLLHRKHGRKLLVSLTQPGNVLQCEITDNGIGREKSRVINEMRNPDHKSFATEATQSRIELLNQDRKFPIVEIISDANSEDSEFCGTKVTLKIPKK